MLSHWKCCLQFQSTLPARGATSADGVQHRYRAYFNPRSPHGERPLSCDVLATYWDFNPRSPHGERRPRYSFVPHFAHFNPRSPHGERRFFLLQSGYPKFISIHAPRTGSDAEFSNRDGLSPDFNPRSPHGERLPDAGKDRKRPRFQSTLPARGATKMEDTMKQKTRISIHAPRTGSDRYHFFWRLSNVISIHAPRTGSDNIR